MASMQALTSEQDTGIIRILPDAGPLAYDDHDHDGHHHDTTVEPWHPNVPSFSTQLTIPLPEEQATTTKKSLRPPSKTTAPHHRPRLSSWLSSCGGKAQVAAELQQRRSGGEQKRKNRLSPAGRTTTISSGGGGGGESMPVLENLTNQHDMSFLTSAVVDTTGKTNTKNGMPIFNRTPIVDATSHEEDQQHPTPSHYLLGKDTKTTHASTTTTTTRTTTEATRRRMERPSLLILHHRPLIRSVSYQHCEAVSPSPLGTRVRFTVPEVTMAAVILPVEEERLDCRDDEDEPHWCQSCTTCGSHSSSSSSSPSYTAREFHNLITRANNHERKLARMYRHQQDPTSPLLQASRCFRQALEVARDLEPAAFAELVQDPEGATETAAVAGNMMNAWCTDYRQARGFEMRLTNEQRNERSHQSYVSRAVVLLPGQMPELGGPRTTSPTSGGGGSTSPLFASFRNGGGRNNKPAPLRSLKTLIRSNGHSYRQAFSNGQQTELWCDQQQREQVRIATAYQQSARYAVLYARLLAHGDQIAAQQIYEEDYYYV